MPAQLPARGLSAIFWAELNSDQPGPEDAFRLVPGAAAACAIACEADKPRPKAPTTITTALRSERQAKNGCVGREERGRIKDQEGGRLSGEGLLPQILARFDELQETGVGVGGRR